MPKKFVGQDKKDQIRKRLQKKLEEKKIATAEQEACEHAAKQAADPLNIESIFTKTKEKMKLSEDQIKAVAVVSNLKDDLSNLTYVLNCLHDVYQKESFFELALRAITQRVFESHYCSTENVRILLKSKIPIIFQIEEKSLPLSEFYKLSAVEKNDDSILIISNYEISSYLSDALLCDEGLVLKEGTTLSTIYSHIIDAIKTPKYDLLMINICKWLHEESFPESWCPKGLNKNQALLRAVSSKNEDNIFSNSTILLELLEAVKKPTDSKKEHGPQEHTKISLLDFAAQFEQEERGCEEASEEKVLETVKQFPHKTSLLGLDSDSSSSESEGE